MQLKENYVRNLIIRYFAYRLNRFKNVWKSLNTGFLNIQGKGADKNIHTPSFILRVFSCWLVSEQTHWMYFHSMLQDKTYKLIWGGGEFFL